MIPLTLGMVFCGGCMTYTYYDGPQRPKTELAIIKLDVISAVDGKDLSYLTHHNLTVLPGRHSLDLSIDPGKASASTCSLEVNVKAQHVYEGVVDRSPSGRVLAVMDRTDNIIAARHPPLSPAPSIAGLVEPIDVAVIGQLRQLKQMKDDDLLAREEYVRLENDLIGRP